MKYLIFIIILFITSQGMAGWFGGLDVGEIKDLQEEAYQNGRACQRGDTLDACEKFIESFRASVDLIKKYEEEIYSKVDKGDSDCEQIIHNAKRLLSLSSTLH